MTVLTDALLAAACLIWGWLVTRRLAGGLASRYWGRGMMLTGTGAAAGGAWHALAPQLSPSTSATLWTVTLILSGASAAFLVIGAAWAVLQLRVAAQLAVVANVELAIYVAATFMLRSFVPVIVQSLLALVALAILFATHVSRPGAKWVLAGVAVSVIAASIQALRIAPHPSFNHNDLYHVIQTGGMYCFYRGGRLFTVQDSGASLAA